MNINFNNEVEENFITINKEQLNSLRQQNVLQHFQEQSSSNHNEFQQQHHHQPDDQDHQINDSNLFTMNQNDASGLFSEEIGMSLKERIVDLMPNYPAIWCTNLRSYKDLNKKDATWRELSEKLNETGM